MSEHTPGPWFAKIALGDEIVKTGVGELIADVYGCGEYDARLIAAAPDLLAALAAILEIGKRDLSNPKYDGYFETARLAIARGRLTDSAWAGALGTGRRERGSDQTGQALSLFLPRNRQRVQGQGEDWSPPWARTGGPSTASADVRTMPGRREDWPPGSAAHARIGTPRSGFDSRPRPSTVTGEDTCRS